MGMKATQIKDVDLSMFMSKNMFTNDINLIKGNSVIQQSIKNLVLTILGRRGFNTSIGTIVYSSLFSQNIVPGEYNEQVIAVQNSIYFVLSNFEPRIENITVKIEPSTDKTLNFSITYNNKSSEQTQTLNITI